jgi:hypothetical protein
VRYRYGAAWRGVGAMQEHAVNHRTGPHLQEGFVIYFQSARRTCIESECDGGRQAVGRGNQVHHRLRDSSSHALIALILAAVFCAALPASAEIFMCVAKDGSPLYQNFPCQFESIGWMPSDLDKAKTDAAKTTAKPSDASQSKSKSAPINVASIVKSTDASEPLTGMTADDVRAFLGEPEEMVDDEPAEGGRVSVWRYADGRSVQFDHKHRVLGIQR